MCVWSLTQKIRPRPDAQTTAELEEQARSWAAANGYSGIEADRIVAIKLAGAKAREKGGTNEATVSCQWDGRRTLVSREFQSVQGEALRSESQGETAFLTDIDYVSKSVLAPIGSENSFSYLKVVPRGDPSMRFLFSSLFDEPVFTNLDLRQVFPAGQYEVETSELNIILTRLFTVQDGLTGVGVKAHFDAAASQLEEISLLTPNGGAYDRLQLTWGQWNGVSMPIEVVETTQRGDGTLIGTQVWKRISYKPLEDRSELDSILTKGATITDCRFGQGQSISYQLPGNELPPDEFVRGLIERP